MKLMDTASVLLFCPGCVLPRMNKERSRQDEEHSKVVINKVTDICFELLNIVTLLTFF